MALKLSIFTTITNPIDRGDNYIDASNCYEELADEVVVVDGTYRDTNTRHQFKAELQGEDHNKVVLSEWPQEFSWEFIGQQFQRGYEACTGDWVIHADLDFIFHEQDFDNLREACANNNHMPAISFYKYQFILPDRYNLKSRLVIAVNKGRFGNRIRFDSGGDLAQPSLDGKYISPDDAMESKIPFYNYEKMTKTKDQIKNDVGRMERAYSRHFGKTQYGSDGTDDDAYKKWIEAQLGKFNKPQEHIKLEDHPKFVRDTIKNLIANQFGHSGFNKLGINNYVKN